MGAFNLQIAGRGVPASQLSALIQLGDLAFGERIVITQDRTIVDGYARVKLAQLKERQALPCIVYELTKTEALQSLLLKTSSIERLERLCPQPARYQRSTWFGVRSIIPTPSLSCSPNRSPHHVRR